MEVINDLGLQETPDAVIVSEAYLFQKNNPDSEIVFVTDDISCYNIASQIFHLKTRTMDESSGEIYKGYVKLEGTSEELTSKLENLDLNQLYVNEYVVTYDSTLNKWQEMRYDGNGLVALRLPPQNFLKAKNSLQRCALDALVNKDIDIVAVLGTYGSGKTFLSMQMALYAVKEKGYQSKILGVREARGEGAAVGYLPGEFENKVGDFFRPLEQQLKGGEFELESLKSRGVLEMQIPYYLKGTTYNSTVMIVDEAEDLTESEVRLVGTRLGQGSRIFFAGDYNQSLINKSTGNPLVKMCEEFKGNRNFACVFLEDDVRSEASKMFATLFKN